MCCRPCCWELGSPLTSPRIADAGPEHLGCRQIDAAVARGHLSPGHHQHWCGSGPDAPAAAHIVWGQCRMDCSRADPQLHAPLCRAAATAAGPPALPDLPCLPTWARHWCSIHACVGSNPAATRGPAAAAAPLQARLATWRTASRRSSRPSRACRRCASRMSWSATSPSSWATPTQRSTSAQTRAARAQPATRPTAAARRTAPSVTCQVRRGGWAGEGARGTGRKPQQPGELQGSGSRSFHGSGGTAWCTCQRCRLARPPPAGFEDAEMELVRHVSFVDCPGHDILMATMLNGAAVMDGAMLLIAANEPCPQPQTSEHLAAVEIMRLQHIIILQVGGQGGGAREGGGWGRRGYGGPRGPARCQCSSGPPRPPTRPRPPRRAAEQGGPGDRGQRAQPERDHPALHPGNHRRGRPRGAHLRAAQVQRGRGVRVPGEEDPGACARLCVAAAGAGRREQRVGWGSGSAAGSRAGAVQCLLRGEVPAAAYPRAPPAPPSPAPR